MILRSVGIAGAIVVGLAVASALTLLPALPDDHRSRGSTASPSARSAPTPGTDGPWARLARRVMRHPVAVLIPTLALAAPARLAVPARPVQRPRRLDPAARGAVAGRVRPAQGRVRRGRVRADRPGHPDRRRRDRPRPTWPRCTTTRAGSRPTRASRRVDSLVDVDPRLTLAQYTLLYGDPNGPRDRYVQTALAATTRGDLTAFTLYTPYGPNRDEGKALVAALRTPGGPLAPPAGIDGPGRRRRGRRRRRRRSGPGRLPADGAVHHRVDLSRAVRPAALGRPAGQGAGHEHAVDRRQLRGARLDLPGRQPVVGPRLPAARVRRDDPAGDPVLRPVRPVDGLRGLPPVADEGGLGPDRRQRRGGRRRDGAERPDRHLGGAHRGRRGRLRSRSPTSC